FQAEHLENKYGGGERAKVALSKTVQKLWAAHKFRAHIDGFSNVQMHRVNKIDSFTFKQNVKPVPIGAHRMYQLEPTTLEYPNISIYIPLAWAEPFVKWHKSFVIEGNNSAKYEKTGSITLIDPTGNDDLLTINLFGVGVVGLTIDKADSSQDQI